MVSRDQIAEARLAGADAILLIVSALDQTALEDFQAYARSLDLDVLVEVHDEAEFARACAIGADLIGLNNRDLKTFEVDLAATERIAAGLRTSTQDPNPDIVLISESGITNFADVKRLATAGAHGFLVGESLMRQPDPGRALEALLEENPLQLGRETKS